MRAAMRVPAVTADLRDIETLWQVESDNPWCVQMRAPGREVVLISTDDIAELATSADEHLHIVHASGLTLHRDGEWVWVWPDDRLCRIPQCIKLSVADIRRLSDQVRRLCQGRRLKVPDFVPREMSR